MQCQALLALWERGLGHANWALGDALLQAGDDVGVPRTLGERTVRLLKLHGALFGAEIELLSHCPSCDSAAYFTSDCEALIEHMPAAASGAAQRLELDELAIEFRLPGPADLAAASSEETDEGFARRVLDRCVLTCTRGGENVPVGALPDGVLDALSRRMEALDPGAAVSFALDCPQCATHWSAALDVGQLVWQKVQVSAERLLLDVDALARAYGWTERDVLSLSPARRAAYLQIVTA
jgi:hypothetical protein